MTESGRLIQLIPAAPGWWAKLKVSGGGDPVLAPIAAWGLVEHNAEDGTAERFMKGIDATGEDWFGQELDWDGLIEYVFDPSPETLARYLAERRLPLSAEQLATIP
jgi:hypothetical protein